MKTPVLLVLLLWISPVIGQKTALEVLESILAFEWKGPVIMANYQFLQTDPDLALLRKMDGYKELMRKYFPQKTND